LAHSADPNARDRKGKSLLAEWTFKADQILEIPALRINGDFRAHRAPASILLARFL
jgi:hypothetical protein